MFSQLRTGIRQATTVRRLRSFVIAAALISVLQTANPASASDAVMDWNRIALAATVTAGQGAVPQVRSMAIVHASIHDAVNVITHMYDPYLPTAAAPYGASPEAAAIAAAHYALTRLFPAQRPALDLARAGSLSSRGLTEANPGIAVGEAAAGAILAARATDGAAQAQFPYVAPGAGSPGVWVAVGSAPVVLPGWGRVTPWVLRSGSQFRPDDPPSLDSERYARDYNEVKELGSINSLNRTTEQTQIALFWNASPSAIWNGVMRQVIEARGLNLSSAARAFALLYLASADASIACWDAKYTHNFWRPITAIQNGDLDGNDQTVADPAWQPLILTHQHPEYPSGHSCNSGAMGSALRMLFDDEPGAPIVATSPGNPGFLREWTTFSEGVQEVIDARVYIGFHFRTSDEVGVRLGRQVARFVFTHALKVQHNDSQD